MTYDGSRGNVVLFGGGEVPNPLLNDTWVWDGSTWMKKHPAHSPPPVYHPLLVYDTLRQQVLLVGTTIDYSTPSLGIKLVQFVMWSWDGVDWRELPAASFPSPRYDEVLAFDSARGQLVLAGGRTPTGYDLRDTRVWDGQTWTLKDSTTAPPSQGDVATGIYDHGSQRVVAFSPPAGTYVWDGNHWAKQTPKHSPSGYELHALVQHPVSSGIGGLFIDAAGAFVWDWTGADWDVMWPKDLTSWRTYTAPEGFRLQYPPYWYALPQIDPAEPHRYFSNENVGAPLMMDQSGLWVQAQATAQPCQAPTATASASVTLGGLPATRYTLSPGGPSGTSGILVLASRSTGCVSVALSTYFVATRDANAAVFDELISRFTLG
jgi:hypothetical protein